MKIRRILALVVFCFLISNLNTYAQYYGGGYGGYGYGGYGGGYGGYGSFGYMGGGMSRLPAGSQKTGLKETMTSEDFITSSGLFMIDQEPLLKKCKIKKKEIIDQITVALMQYQKVYELMSYKHAVEIEELKAFADIPEGAELVNYRDDLMARAKVIQKIKPSTRLMHKKLDDTMLKLFEGDKKATRNWTRYYRNLCHENYFIPLDEEELMKKEAARQAIEARKKEEKKRGGKAQVDSAPLDSIEVK